MKNEKEKFFLLLGVIGVLLLNNSNLITVGINVSWSAIGILLIIISVWGIFNDK